jgi:hypothetical protein
MNKFLIITLSLWLVINTHQHVVILSLILRRRRRKDLLVFFHLCYLSHPIDIKIVFKLQDFWFISCFLYILKRHINIEQERKLIYSSYDLAAAYFHIDHENRRYLRNHHHVRHIHKPDVHSIKKHSKLGVDICQSIDLS